MPAANGELLPLPSGGAPTSIHHHFYDFFSKGATLSLEQDNGNGVWKLGNLNGLPSNGPILRTDILAGQSTAGETGRISFRYKGEGATVNITSGNTDITKDVTCQTSEPNENGWKTVTAEFTFITANHNGVFAWRFPVPILFSLTISLL